MIAVPLVGLVGYSRRADAAFLIGWADEFLVGFAHCRLSNNQCTMRNHWKGQFWLEQIGDAPAQHTWTYLGRQTGNATGRANVKSKLMVTFRDDSTSVGGQVTFTISRRRTGVPGDEATPCFGNTFVGSASQTFESTSGGGSDTKSNNRMLPVMDFSLESWSGGMTIGYEETIIGTGSMGMEEGKTGCFKILWD